MLGSRFLWKLYVGFACLILTTTAIVGLLIARQIERDSLVEIEQWLRLEATLLRDLEGPEAFADPARSQARLERVGSATQTRLTLIRADGVVVADSAKDPSTIENHGRRPEVLAAVRGGEGIAKRTSATTGLPTMYLALPLFDGDRLLGVVRASLPLTAIGERRARLRSVVVFGAGAATIFALALGFFLARRVTRPIVSMTTVAEALAAGDTTRRVPAESSDEIGALARSFNRMADELEARLATIDRDRTQLLAILGGMVEGVVALDAEERVVHMNRAAAHMLETDAATATGHHIWELVRAPAIGDALRQALAGGAHTAEARFAARTADRVLELHAAPLRQGGAVLVLYDVTELKRLAAVRTDFVANVSHELKTPVTAIVGLVETILDDPEMPLDVERRFLAKISDNGRRLSLLVTDLLALSRLEGGEGALERVTLDLRTPIDEAVQSQLVVAEAKRLELCKRLPAKPLLVRGDHEALREAVENLLSNAVRYTPDHGQVVVRLLETPQEAVIEVEDTGPGIEAQHLERIFERFYRVDRARSRELGGTGLGLSIVKHTALAHGGQVAVESSPGKGSLFRVRLPRLA